MTQGLALHSSPPSRASGGGSVPKRHMSATFHGAEVLITGASRGLGLAFTSHFLRAGATVHATCRSPDTAHALAEMSAKFPDLLHIHKLDVAVPLSAQAVAMKLKRLDVLVNNAGVATRMHPVDSIVESDCSELMSVFRVNVGGSIFTTNAFLEPLRRGKLKLIVNISSDLGSIQNVSVAQSAKVKGGGVSGYRISKAALNMATRIHAAELGAENFKVVALSPGWVATDMGTSGGRSPPLTPDQSVSGCLNVLANLTDSDNGKFFRYDGNEVPW